MKPDELVRHSETKYKELELSKYTEEQLIDAVVENPILLERPIVRYRQQAAIGRPLDNIIDLFD